MYTSFLVLIVGLCLNGVMCYSPLLTYTIRYKNMIMHPNISGELTIDQFREKQFVNGNIIFNSKESIDNVVAVFYRCKLGGNDCEYVNSWKFTDLCAKLKEKNQLWTSWYNAFDPPMICPLNKIHYKVRNATVDLGPALLLYPTMVDYQWKVVQKFYVGNEYVGSYTMVVECFGYRKKIKLI